MGAEAVPIPEPNRPLMLALARAYKWQKMMDAGEVRSLGELTERYGVDRSYISRISVLGALAPDILEAISLRQLKKGPPACWQTQRRKWHTSRRAYCSHARRWSAMTP